MWNPWSSMLKIILLLICLLLGMIFLVVDNIGIEKLSIGFPFSPAKIRIQDYVYFFNESVIKIVLSYIIYAESIKYRFALWVFCWLMVADLFDFILTFNTVWYHIVWVPISMNTLSVVIFALSILKSYNDER